MMDLKVYCIFSLICLASGVFPPSTPRILLYPNHNNVYGYVYGPGLSVGQMKFLGMFNTTQECITACVSYKQGRCLTFTFHTPAFQGEFSKNCFGGVELPLWSPMPQDNIDSGKIIWDCTSSMDCSLNGKCVLGVCDCNKGWGGYRCDELNLARTNRTSGYHYMENGKNVSSWGGAVVRDDNGTYHMFAAEMTNHCGINSWFKNSQIIHAVSDSPTGTFKRHDVVRPPFAHEPTAIRGPNGEYILYWSEFHYNLPLCNCSDGSTTPSCRAPQTPRYYTLMSYSMSPYGPWSNPVKVIHQNFRTSDTNFAPVILKNGSLVGFSRHANVNGSRIHLVTASNWKDPSSYMEDQNEVWPHLGFAGTEDPYMYLDKDGHFHAIFHNMYPVDYMTNCGGHAYSQDGITWVYGGKAYDNIAWFTDGATFTFSRVERPHLVFAADGVTILALTNGAQYGGQYGDATYTRLHPVL